MTILSTFRFRDFNSNLIDVLLQLLVIKVIMVKVIEEFNTRFEERIRIFGFDLSHMERFIFFDVRAYFLKLT